MVFTKQEYQFAITINRGGYQINRPKMVMSRKFIKLIMIKKIYWSKIVKYSIKQYNTSFAVTRNAIQALKTFITRFCPL